MAKLTVIDWRALAAIGLGIPYAALWLADARAAGSAFTDGLPPWVDGWSGIVQDVLRDGGLAFPVWFVALVLLLAGAGLALDPVLREPARRRYPMVNLVVALVMLAGFGFAAWSVGMEYYAA